MNSKPATSSPSVMAISDALASGNVIAYPTEGVWGLGCDPANEDAVMRILEIKSRPIEKGMILIAGEAEQLSNFVDELPEFPESEIPTTWLVAHGGLTPNWISGGSDKVAVRVSAHPAVQNICASTGSAVVSTSANPAGEEPALTMQEVEQYFGNLIDLIVPGDLGGQTGSSQIIDWETKEIIRRAG